MALLLEKAGYEVRVAQSYIDPDEEKPREIDVVAYKEFANPGPMHIPHVLVIECKSTPQPHVAFTRNWRKFERENKPYEILLNAAQAAYSEATADKMRRKRVMQYAVPSIWESADLRSEWEILRLNVINKATQIVRIERQNKNHSARNSIFEMGLPPIKAAFDIRQRYTKQNAAIFPACVTGGPLYSISPEGVESQELREEELLCVEYSNRAQWMRDTATNYFDIVPFDNLEIWLKHVRQVVGALNSRMDQFSRQPI